MTRSFLLLFMLPFTQPLFAQQVDSSFHNYWFDSRLAYFRQLPAKKQPVIFWGDSITEWADWNELTGLGNVLNRGIAGDITYGMYYRADEIIRHRPRKLFMLIGTNDINKGIPIATIVDKYETILRKIKKELPATQIYVQSVLPINDSLINRQYYKGSNQEIKQLNTKLQRMAAALEVPFINLFDEMLDDKQQLDLEFTYDGLHLSGQGYLCWIRLLKEKKIL